MPPESAIAGLLVVCTVLVVAAYHLGVSMGGSACEPPDDRRAGPPAPPKRTPGGLPARGR